ncbi:hypothetical protein Goshw_001131 [Gossypium schwendimanii]|uniref:Uncharacterized protein n=1 Tax=Gossypium schwendimanii TaxID=34291 RepID=A0A7J9LCW0_GOSSC|nr:hypothetical protein [Gossypium schwendimanii]
MGSLAYCSPNCLPSMFILPYSWSLLVIPRRHPRFSFEFGLFLRLCYRHYLHCYWLVCHRFVSAQLYCRVRS